MLDKGGIEKIGDFIQGVSRSIKDSAESDSDRALLHDNEYEKKRKKGQTDETFYGAGQIVGEIVVQILKHYKHKRKK